MDTHFDESDCDTCSTSSVLSISSQDMDDDKYCRELLGQKSVHFNEQVEIFVMPSRHDIAHLFSDLYYEQREIRHFKDERYHEVRTHVMKHKCSVRQAMCDLYQIDQEDEQGSSIHNESTNTQQMNIFKNITLPDNHFIVDYESKILQLCNDF